MGDFSVVINVKFHFVTFKESSSERPNKQIKREQPPSPPVEVKRHIFTKVCFYKDWIISKQTENNSI